MKKTFSLLITFVILMSLFIKGAYADIDLIVTPIIYEIEVDPGTSIIKTAKLINKTSKIMTIYTSVSDFEANNSYGNPTFVRKSELVNPDQEMASWINIEHESFVIGALEEKEVSFLINVPSDATPGGHYGAMFFKSFGEKNSNGQVKINVDYGVLLLINVSGEIIDDTTTGETEIKTTGSSLKDYLKIDNCILGDFTNSNFDGKCFDTFGFNIAIQKILKKENVSDERITINKSGDEIGEYEITNLNSAKEIEDDEFKVEIGIPIKNNGNTHIKPVGKVTLIDEDGKEIKSIGKEVLVNENSMIIGEKIVDYLPINDGGGNVLPNSERILTTEWKGFPYESYDDNGKKIIKYWSPGEYYSKLNIASRAYLYPWERINKKLEQKKVNALIELGYINHDGEKIKFNSAEEFYVDYTTEYIGLNLYIIVFGILTFGLAWLIWFIYRRKTRKECENCKKTIKKDMKICPYCGTKQKEKKN